MKFIRIHGDVELFMDNYNMLHLAGVRNIRTPIRDFGTEYGEKYRRALFNFAVRKEAEHA